MFVGVRAFVNRVGGSMIVVERAFAFFVDFVLAPSCEGDVLRESIQNVEKKPFSEKCTCLS